MRNTKILSYDLLRCVLIGFDIVYRRKSNGESSMKRRQPLFQKEQVFRIHKSMVGIFGDKNCSHI